MEILGDGGVVWLMLYFQRLNFEKCGQIVQKDIE
jgi:hypothetical protein